MRGESPMQKRYRLSRREDFAAVYRRGKSAANYQFVVYYQPRPENEKIRLGVSVSRKVGKAVVRNRVRRLVKEIIRQMMERDQIRPGYDLVVIARKPAAEQDFGAMERSLRHVLSRADLLQPAHRGRT